MERHSVLGSREGKLRLFLWFLSFETVSWELGDFGAFKHFCRKDFFSHFWNCIWEPEDSEYGISVPAEKTVLQSPKSTPLPASLDPLSGGGPKVPQILLIKVGFPSPFSWGTPTSKEFLLKYPWVVKVKNSVQFVSCELLFERTYWFHWSPQQTYNIPLYNCDDSCVKIATKAQMVGREKELSLTGLFVVVVVVVIECQLYIAGKN